MTTKALYELTTYFDTHPGWCSRREIATALRRAGGRLQPNDFKALDRLIDDGVIQVRTRDNVHGGGMRYEYRRKVGRITER